MEALDLRTMAVPVPHELVHERLNALALGETVELLVDHRPTPLRYELEATRPGDFEWVDDREGPPVWSVRITRRVRAVDARPILDRGDEPFDQIIKAEAKVRPGECLVVLAPFEPVPLEGVLAGLGFTYEAGQLPRGDWRVAFRRVA